MSDTEPLSRVVDPTGHGVHLEAEARPFAAPYVPTGQGAQSDMAVAGCAAAKVPRGHGKQAPSLRPPGVGLKEPAGQLAQAAASAVAPVELPNVPGGQRWEQARIESDWPDALPYRPWGHASQVVAFSCELYDPLGHGRHAVQLPNRPPAVSRKPAPHVSVNGRQLELSEVSHVPAAHQRYSCQRGTSVRIVLLFCSDSSTYTPAPDEFVTVVTFHSFPSS